MKNKNLGKFFLFSLLFLFVINFISATTVQDCSIYGNCKAITSSGGGNGSTTNNYYNVSGGNPFDQSLNTTDNVEFENLTAGNILLKDGSYDYGSITNVQKMFISPFSTTFYIYNSSGDPVMYLGSDGVWYITRGIVAGDFQIDGVTTTSNFFANQILPLQDGIRSIGAIKTQIIETGETVAGRWKKIVLGSEEGGLNGISGVWFSDDGRGIDAGAYPNASIYYNGTDLVFHTNRVGQADAFFTKNVNVKGNVSASNVFASNLCYADGSNCSTPSGLQFINDSDTIYNKPEFTNLIFNGGTTVNQSNFMVRGIATDVYAMSSAPLVYNNGGGDNNYDWDVDTGTEDNAYALNSRDINDFVKIKKGEQEVINADGGSDWGVALVSGDFGSGTVYLTIYFDNNFFTNSGDFETWFEGETGASVDIDYYEGQMFTANSYPNDYTWSNPDSLAVVTGFQLTPTLNFGNFPADFFKVDVGSGKVYINYGDLYMSGNEIQNVKSIITDKISLSENGELNLENSTGDEIGYIYDNGNFTMSGVICDVNGCSSSWAATGDSPFTNDTDTIYPKPELTKLLWEDGKITLKDTGVAPGKNNTLLLTPDAIYMDYYGSSTTPIPEGAGYRFQWIPQYAAFRAGRAMGGSWDESNLGTGSVAFGSGNIASGTGTFAVGYTNIASGQYSSAFGNTNLAEGWYSLVNGYLSNASGRYSTAMGVYEKSSGYYSTAMGYSTQASGQGSVAMGLNENDDETSFVAGNSSINDKGGKGQIAMGYASAGQTLKAEGTGSLAMGQDVNALLNNNILVFGRGFSTSVPDSFNIGFGGLNYQFTNTTANFTNLDIITTGNITANNFFAGKQQGINANITILKDVDLIGLTKTYCHQNFTGGLLTWTDC